MAARILERATYQDLLNAPDNLTAELVDGELFLSPQPAVPHSRFASALHGRRARKSRYRDWSSTRPGPIHLRGLAKLNTYRRRNS